MEISEIIGMLISIAAILFLVIRPLWEARKEKRNPQEYAEAKRKKERRLKDFMKELDIDIDDEDEEIEEEVVRTKKVPPKREKEKPGYVHEHKAVASTPKLFKTPKRSTQELHQAKQMDVSHPEMRKERVSRGRSIINGLKSKKDMVILHDIIGPPKSL